MAENVLYCAGCNVRYRAKAYDATKAYKCPKCGGPIQVQGPSAETGDGVSLDTKGAPRDTQEKDPLVGTRIGQYKITKKLGQGGMGAVYLAAHLELGRNVALKILPQKMVKEDPDAVERFKREARSAAVLEHPNVVTIYHVGNVGDHHFIEMQLVDGESLYDRLKREKRLSLGEATRIVRDAAAAFAAAHKQNIVHRDIKPANIMLTREGQVKVMDFGLAKDVAAPTQLTVTGHIMGTPYYMSPEQCDAQKLDGRADIYSLGATYFHLLTGKFPFTGDSLFQIMRQHADAPVPDLRSLLPSLPAAVQPVIEKAMAKRPEERFQTMEELAAALGQIQSAEADDVPTVSTVATTPSASAGAAPVAGALGDVMDEDEEREHHLHTSRIRGRIKEVQAFLEAWKGLAKAAAASRKKRGANEAEEAEFAALRDTIRKQYAGIFRRLGNPGAPGQRVVSACDTGITLSSIAQMPDADFRDLSNHFQTGAKLLFDYLGFLEDGRQDLLKQSTLYYYWDKVAHNAAARAIASVAAVALIGLIGWQVAARLPKPKKSEDVAAQTAESVEEELEEAEEAESKETEADAPPAKPAPPTPRSMTPDELHAALKAKNPEYAADGRFTVRDGKIVEIDLADRKIEDISPLAGLPLEALNLTKTKTRDIDPLPGMPLTTLRLESCNGLWRDATPLADCRQLERLVLPKACEEIEFLRNHPKLKSISFTYDEWKQTAAEFWSKWDAAAAPAAATEEELFSIEPPPSRKFFPVAACLGGGPKGARDKAAFIRFCRPIVKTLKDLGFNTVMFYANQYSVAGQLEVAKELGMKAILYASPIRHIMTGSKPGTFEQIQAEVKRFVDATRPYNSVIAYIVYADPADPQWLDNWRLLGPALDAETGGLPALACYRNILDLKKFDEVWPLHGYQHFAYPFSKDVGPEGALAGRALAAPRPDVARRAVPRLSVWPWLQGIEVGSLVMPTAVEMEALSYTCLAHGATGLIYYKYTPPSGVTTGTLCDANYKPTPVLRQFSVALPKIKKMGEALLGCEILDGYVSATGKVRAAYFHDGKQKRYLLLASWDTERAVKTTVTIDGTKVKAGTLEDVVTGEKIPCRAAGSSATATVDLRPGGGRLLSIGPAGAPSAAPAPVAQLPQTFDFNAPTLDSGWRWVRENREQWSLTAAPGSLRIVSQEGGIHAGTKKPAPNLLLRPAPSGDFHVETKLAMEPKEGWQQGGIVLYRDEKRFLRVNLAAGFDTPSKQGVELGYSDGGKAHWADQATPQPVRQMWLAIAKRGATYTGRYSYDGKQWHSLEPVEWKVTDFSIGLAAFNEQCKTPIPADFDYLEISRPTTPAAPSTTPSLAYGYLFTPKPGDPEHDEHLSALASYTNVAMASRPETIEALARKGMKAIASCGVRELRRGDVAAFKRIFAPVWKAHRDHIFALSLVDEPYASGMSREQLASLVTNAKQAFPDVPVFVNFQLLEGKAKLPQIKDPIPDNLDIVGFDDYVQGTPAEVKQRTLSNIQLLKRLSNGKPVFVYGRAFVMAPEYAAPLTPDEAMAYKEAVVEGGASALIWAFFERTRWKTAQGASTFPSILSTHREIARELGVCKREKPSTGLVYGYWLGGRTLGNELEKRLSALAPYTNLGTAVHPQAVAALAGKGMRVLARCGVKELERGDMAAFKRVFEPVWKAHRDDIFAYYLVDEPYANDMSRDQLASLVTKAKQAFPDLPVFVNFLLGDKAKLPQSGDPIPDNVDIVGFDDYVQGTPAEVKQRTLSNIRLLQRLSKGKPVLVFGRAFVRAPDYATPLTPEEAIAYKEAVVEGGAVGLVWFSAQGASKFPAVLSAHREIGKELGVR